MALQVPHFFWSAALFCARSIPDIVTVPRFGLRYLQRQVLHRACPKGLARVRFRPRLNFCSREQFLVISASNPSLRKADRGGIGLDSGRRKS
jgi:hypothetical protein